MEKENGKKFQKKTLIFIVILLAVAITAVLLIFHFRTEEPEEVISGGETVTEDDDSVNPITTDDDKEETETVIVGKETVNAYDYILEIMNEPQYWSEEEYFPAYSAPWYTEEAKETLVNGTGWYLADEATATFERGYLSKFSINFSTHVAMSVNELDQDVYYLDFENDIYYREVCGRRYDITSINNYKGTDWYWQSVYGLADRTFCYYEEIFEAAGCSLLNQPEGTLSSYKNATANRVTLVDDGLIHAPWKQEGFTFAWEEHMDEVEWLTDYRDILKIEVPDSETVPVTRCDINDVCSDIEYGKYSPLYLVVADKNASEEYLRQDGSVWFESITLYSNATEALAVYWLAPIMKDIYGYSGVYFVDESSLNGSTDIRAIDSVDQFLDGIYQHPEESSNTILEIFNVGDMPTGCGYYASDDNTCFLQLFDDIRELYDYYGKTYKYAFDYLGNFMIVYNIKAQLILGLR